MYKTKTLLFLLTFLTSAIYAQDYKGVFAIINDVDGYSNVRNSSKKIIGRIIDYEVFAIASFLDKADNVYVPIIYGWGLPDIFTRFGWGEKASDKLKEKEGFIHQSRVKYLYDLPRLTKTLTKDRKIVFSNNDATFNIVIGAFDKMQHKIGKDQFGCDATIDSYPIHGIDGEIEYKLYDGSIRKATEIKSIHCVIDGDSFSFQKEHLCGYLEPNTDSMYMVKAATNVYYLVMLNSDGAGGYEIVWTIKDKKIKSAITFRDF
ncbi:hypothetical protein JGH11_11185 [Dysgonomonas sp. Marseille-P4677]|nr:hypothetical protein [Dysgonomonas sp. Marseille-P4677]MBK5721437.1 hypothetical protein [Dysgonomonas sp. Marseille-P4677]